MLLGGDWIPLTLTQRLRNVGAQIEVRLRKREVIIVGKLPESGAGLYPVASTQQFIAVFAGWVMCRNSTADELGGAGLIYKIWRVLARFVVPVAILIVFLKSSGLLPDFG